MAYSKLRLSCFILFLLLLAPGIIAVALEDDDQCEEAIGCRMTKLPSSWSRKLMLRREEPGQNCTHHQFTQVSYLASEPSKEIGDEKVVGSGPKQSSKSDLLKMFGLEDEHGQNCAATNESCIFNACCHGCECLRFMLWCVGDC